MAPIKIAVRELVEMTLKQGSIEAGTLIGGQRLILGTLAHKKVQQAMGPHYEAEVPLSYTIQVEGIDFMIEGRVDGIIQDLVGVTIDEIKSTYTSLHQIDEDYNALHWAQAKCYGYIYAVQQGLSKVDIRLTYYNLTTKGIKHLVQHHTREALEDFFYSLLTSYAREIKWQERWVEKRNISLRQYQFPFETYRKGQREMAVSIYKSIVEGNKLYVNAPTGTGKTISTLFPAIKAMGEGHVKKLFYLTAKTITRTVAENTVIMMHQAGAVLKSITLTAKDKICPLEERKCNKEDCKFACGHFDRIDKALKDALEGCDIFTPDKVKAYAHKHCVCPFEFALDLSGYMDIIICDYNYIFDPVASLKRFQENKDKGVVILVDEAHNLTERAREMFSKQLSQQMVRQARRSLPKGLITIRQALTKIDSYLTEVEYKCLNTQSYTSKEKPKELKALVKTFVDVTDEKLQEGIGKLPTDFTDFYFETRRFLKIYEMFDHHYITYGEKRGADVYIKMFCLDPSFLMSEVLSTCQSTIFFSATLLPIEYYKYMLGGIEDKAISVPAVFENNQSIRLVATDVSTRYQHREESYVKIANYVHEVVKMKQGNYMIFFPSYQYMIKTYEIFCQLYQQYEVLLQKMGMTEGEKEFFLGQFTHGSQTTMIGFCVLGGSFSEGIDLTGDRLIGVIVVGVGLPQIGLERDLIKYYFEEQHMAGYHYAYTYPGMNKVLQAVGRLIRTERDAGVMLFIDDRYNTPLYKQLMPSHLKPVKLIDIESLTVELTEFWRKR